MKSYKNKQKNQAFMGDEDRDEEQDCIYAVLHDASVERPYDITLQRAHSEARARLPAKAIADQHEAVELDGLEEKVQTTA
jgi:hypothetical protein